MHRYLKGCKLWLYVFGDRPIPEKVDKETDSTYAIRIGCKLWLYVFGDRPIPEKVDKETDSTYAIRIED